MGSLVRCIFRSSLPGGHAKPHCIPSVVRVLLQRRAAAVWLMTRGLRFRKPKGISALLLSLHRLACVCNQKAEMEGLMYSDGGFDVFRPANAVLRPSNSFAACDCSRISQRNSEIHIHGIQGS